MHLKILRLSLIIGLSSFSFFTQALVDYTDNDSYVPKNSGARSVKDNPAPSIKPQARSVAKKSYSGPRHYRLSSEITYGSQDIKLNDTNGKADVVKFSSHFSTDYNIFLDASYYQMSSSSNQLAGNQDSGMQKGNPELKIGFNWLEIGRANDAVTVDIYGGYTFGQKNSFFATSRDDQIIGVTTAKRFFQFVVGLGYELRMTGTPNDQELDIGNISTIEANLGWMVSNDIRFVLNAKSYRVNRSDEDNRFGLTQDLSFSTLSPKAVLSISPHINLSLSAQFQTRRLKARESLNANLWMLDAPYGTSLMAGLSFVM